MVCSVDGVEGGGREEERASGGSERGRGSPSSEAGEMSNGSRARAYLLRRGRMSKRSGTIA